MLADALAQLEIDGLHAGAALGIAVGEFRADRLVAEAPDRTAAACVEALIGRQAELRCTDVYAAHQLCGEHGPPRRIARQECMEVEVGGETELSDDEGLVRGAVRDRR